MPALEPIDHDPFNIGVNEAAPDLARGPSLVDFWKSWGKQFGQAFSTGLRGAGEAGLQSINEALAQQYKPPGAAGVNDAGQWTDAQGNPLPATRRPTVLPVTRSAQTGEAELAMPSILDVANTIGSPVRGAAGSVTLGAGLTMPPKAAAAPAIAPRFYSAVERAVDTAGMKSAPAEQWLGTLQNAKGVKKEELDWLGVPEFLEAKKGQPVTKQEIADLVRENKVELKEVEKGLTETQADALKFYDSLTREEIETNLTPSQRAQYEILKARDTQPSKFSSYQLPGGENYRELLLTLPEAPGPFGNKAADLANEYRHGLFQKYGNGIRLKATVDEIRKLDDLETRIERKSPDYKSGHWDEPNVLAHIRANDRVIDGKKALFVEEIQSDWHQAGKRKGYKTRYRADELTSSSPDPRRSQFENELFWFVKAPDNEFQIPKSKAPTMEDAIKYVASEKFKGGGTIPDAPFKKSWHELALKRMIREAAEKGYDKLAWTTGDVQAARYDLSKQIKEIEYVKNSDGTYKLGIADKEGEPVGALPGMDVNRMSLVQIEETVGKDIAKKVEAGDGRKYRGHDGMTLEGLDLKVGGEGMKGFYDKIIVDAANKIGKPFGAKVSGENLGGTITKDLKDGEYIVNNNGREVGRFGTRDNAQQLVDELVERNGGTAEPQRVHTLDITPAMRDAALGKGFPLFMTGKPPTGSGDDREPVQFEPVDHDPFGGSAPIRFEPIDHDPFAPQQMSGLVVPLPMPSRRVPGQQDPGDRSLEILRSLPPDVNTFDSQDQMDYQNARQRNDMIKLEDI